MLKTAVLPALFAGILLASCSSNETKEAKETKEIVLPGAPSSVKAVQDNIKGKKYKVEKAGTHSLISTDKDITWLEPKEDNKFEKEIVDESKSLQLDFVNETSVTITMKKKAKDTTYQGTYVVDTLTSEDEKPGIKLRISYEDDEFKLGDARFSKVIYTYLVEGINEKSLLLETPRSMNNRKIVVLMNKQ